MSTYELNRPFVTKRWWQRLGSTLRYSFHVLFHPFDGFWDLIHEKRGSIAAANCIVLLLLFSRLMNLEFTSFLIMNVYWPEVNIFEECISLLLPLGIYCLCNWGLTTLFDGKGTLRDVYMATAYALVPYVLTQLAVIPLSNWVTRDEAAFCTVLTTVGIVWSVMLLVCSMIQVHDYSLGKTLIFLFMTAVGMVIVIFLLLLFLTLVGDGIGYFVSMYKEINFRLN